MSDDEDGDTRSEREQNAAKWSAAYDNGLINEDGGPEMEPPSEDRESPELGQNDEKVSSSAASSRFKPPPLPRPFGSISDAIGSVEMNDNDADPESDEWLERERRNTEALENNRNTVKLDLEGRKNIRIATSKGVRKPKVQVAEVDDPGLNGLPVQHDIEIPQPVRGTDEWLNSQFAIIDPEMDERERKASEKELKRQNTMARNRNAKRAAAQELWENSMDTGTASFGGSKRMSVAEKKAQKTRKTKETKTRNKALLEAAAARAAEMADLTGDDNSADQMSPPMKRSRRKVADRKGSPDYETPQTVKRRRTGAASRSTVDANSSDTPGASKSLLQEQQLTPDVTPKTSAAGNTDWKLRAFDMTAPLPTLSNTMEAVYADGFAEALYSCGVPYAVVLENPPGDTDNVAWPEGMIKKAQGLIILDCTSRMIAHFVARFGCQYTIATIRVPGSEDEMLPSLIWHRQKSNDQKKFKMSASVEDLITAVFPAVDGVEVKILRVNF